LTFFRFQPKQISISSISARQSEDLINLE